MDVLALDRQVCFALYSASRAVSAAYRPLLADLGLTYPQYLVLLALWERRGDRDVGLTVGELGRRLHLDSGTLSPLLKRLEAAGYVIRSRSSEDERSVIVRTTDAAEGVRTRAECVPGAIAERLGHSAGDLELLRQSLQTLTAALRHRDPVVDETDPDSEASTPVNPTPDDLGSTSIDTKPTA